MITNVARIFGAGSKPAPFRVAHAGRHRQRRNLWGAREYRSPGRFDAFDGLRTIAVTLVILFHVSVPGMGAGFIGVDLFFVLSGYLITSGLISHIKKNGNIGLANFWAKRIRRLVPAALLVILVVLLLTKIVEPVFRHRTIGVDALWTVFYLGNWRFIDSASYFESDDTASPLLHMWSLAVEEQFYILWPLLILGGLLVARRLRTSVLPITLFIAVVGIGFSLTALILTFHPDTPDRAYMGTDTKIFEPLIGALLAVVTQYRHVNRVLRRNARHLFWAGLVINVAVFAMVGGPSKFYFYGGALLFSLGTVMMIAGLRYGRQTPESKILSYSPITYIGRISYGLYLWHWPFAVWLGTYDEFHIGKTILVLLLTFCAAVISYHYVELPIRQGSVSAFLSTVRTIGSGVVAMVTIAGISLGLGNTPLPTVTKPEETVTVDDRMIMLVGDSVPARMTTWFARVGEERGYTVVAATRGACTPLGVELDFGADNAGRQCPNVLEEQVTTMEEYNPGIILWWSRYDSVARLVDGERVGPESEEFWDLQKATIQERFDELTSTGARIIVIQTERLGIGVLSRSDASFDHPVLDTFIHHDEYRQRMNALMVSIAQTRDDVTLIDGDRLFCEGRPSQPPGHLCDDKYDGALMRPDGSHVDSGLFGRQVATKVFDMAKLVDTATS